MLLSFNKLWRANDVFKNQMHANTSGMPRKLRERQHLEEFVLRPTGDF